MPLGHDQTGRLPVIVGVRGYSRVIAARMIPSRTSADVLGGHLACLVELGAVPREGVYDSEPAIGRRRGDRTEFTTEFQMFRGTLGMGAYVCKPRDPEAKGLVERANRYLETSFLPGRSFTSVADFNAQLHAWLCKANRRVHATLRCRPLDRLATGGNASIAARSASRSPWTWTPRIWTLTPGELAEGYGGQPCPDETFPARTTRWDASPTA